MTDLQRARQELIDTLAYETWHIDTLNGQRWRLRLAVLAVVNAVLQTPLGRLLYAIAERLTALMGG